LVAATAAAAASATPAIPAATAATPARTAATTLRTAAGLALEKNKHAQRVSGKLNGNYMCGFNINRRGATINNI